VVQQKDTPIIQNWISSKINSLIRRIIYGEGLCFTPV
jgi:hypothetical protein